MTKSNFSALHKRNERIFYLYRTYLLETKLKDCQESINSIAYNFNDEQKLLIYKILNNIDILEQKIICHLPKNWKWERLNSLEKAILLNATAEIVITKTKKAIIINESINFAKKYCGVKAQPLLNGIIDKIDDQ